MLFVLFCRPFCRLSIVTYFMLNNYMHVKQCSLDSVQYRSKTKKEPHGQKRSVIFQLQCSANF